MNTVMEASWLRPGDYFIFDERLGLVVEIGVDKYYIELRTGQTFLRNIGRVALSLDPNPPFPVALRPDDIVTKIKIPDEFFISTSKSAENDKE